MSVTVTSVTSPITPGATIYFYGSGFGSTVGMITLVNSNTNAYVQLTPTSWTPSGPVTATAPEDLSPYIYQGTITVSLWSPECGGYSSSVLAASSPHNGVQNVSVYIESGVFGGKAAVYAPATIKFKVLYNDNYVEYPSVTWNVCYNRGTLEQSKPYTASRVAVSGNTMTFDYSSTQGYYIYATATVSDTAYEVSTLITGVDWLVQSLTPNSGSLTNSNFTINGKGFQVDDSSETLGSVQFGFMDSVTYQICDGFQLTGPISNTSAPANFISGNEGIRDYYLVVDDVRQNDFKYTLDATAPAPVITAPTPHYCIKGMAIFITGENFGAVGTAKISGIELSLPSNADLVLIKNSIASLPENAGGSPLPNASSLTTAWNSNVIVALVPNTAISGDLVVTSSNVQSNTWAVTVAGLGKPVCVEAIPNEDKTQFTLNGSNFGDIKGTVKADGQECGIISWTEDKIIVQLSN